MFMAAARALADTAPARRDPAGALLPPLADSRRVARAIAIAVAEAARSEGLADPAATGDVEALVNAKVWQPRYLTMRPKRDRSAQSQSTGTVFRSPDAYRTQSMPLLPTSQYDTLSAMITPAIFLTANASLIISTSNRMSRVVNRIRVLNDLVDKLGRGTTDLDYVPERLEHLRDQLRQLEWRNDRIRYALTTLYIAFTTFVCTSLTLAVNALLSNRLIALPILLAVSVSGCCSSPASTWRSRPSRRCRPIASRSASTASCSTDGWPMEGPSARAARRKRRRPRFPRQLECTTRATVVSSRRVRRGAATESDG